MVTPLPSPHNIEAIQVLRNAIFLEIGLPSQIACKRYINDSIWLESLHYGYG